MKLKRILALTLALILALGTTVFAADGAFTDVADDAYYADAVAWAVEEEITNGRGDGKFAPNATVTRAEAVTFLWRMAGRPEPTQAETFTDVEADPSNSWYKTAVQWAVEQGITNGTGNGNFSPKVTCSRGMILTMLYRMEGRPFDEAAVAEVPEDSDSWSLLDFGNAMIQAIIEACRSEDGFSDVKEGDYFELPVIWASISGILSDDLIDMETNAVRPAAPCPRGEMVYFLYQASGSAPVEGAIQTGKIPETVLFNKDGVTITATGIRSEGLSDAILDLTVVNNSEKTLRVDCDELYVNTYASYGQVCIPTKDEDDWTFYVDAVTAPGETLNCEMRLNGLDDLNIETVCELELRMSLIEVEKGEDGYNYVDDYSLGDLVSLRTSLYEEGASYEMEGTLLFEKDGLKVLLISAENNEYTGPEITLYICNNSNEALLLDLTEMKLDGKSCNSFFGMNTLPAGKRCVEEVSIFLEDYDNIPVYKEAELTFQMMDPDLWEVKEAFAPVKITFAD